MGLPVIMFVTLMVLTVATATVLTYGIEKEAEVIPMKAMNDFTEREEGKQQTDMVVVSTKVNGTMEYTDVDTNVGPETLNLHLSVKNNGSIVLDPRKYSILMNGSWIYINKTSDNSTSPLTTSNTSSLNLTHKPLSLIISAENGKKIITPTAPVLHNISSETAGCYYNLTIKWDPSYGEIWPITHYALYYTTDSSDIIDKNNVSVALTIGPDQDYYMGNAFRKSGGGSCEEPEGESHVFIWLSAFDTHGNEGPPSNTCESQGSSEVDCIEKTKK